MTCIYTIMYVCVSLVGKELTKPSQHKSYCLDKNLHKSQQITYCKQYVYNNNVQHTNKMKLIELASKPIQDTVCIYKGCSGVHSVVTLLYSMYWLSSCTLDWRFEHSGHAGTEGRVLLRRL